MTDAAPLVPLPPRRVARVAVDAGLAHLDRPFDYEVPEAWDADAVPGARVRLRFAGRLRDGIVLERVDQSEVESLAPLEKVVSAEPVLTSEVAGLLRQVADRTGGTLYDLIRLAVPPRHAATEKAPRPEVAPPAPSAAAAVLPAYPHGGGYLAALGEGTAPRAAWHVAPVAAAAGQWWQGFVEAAAITVSAGRGALLLAPDARDLAMLRDACTARFGRGGFAVMTSDAGPSARYRAFLAAERGEARVVIGTRAAVFAPVRDLGLVALWDDGDDLWAEPRAPYPHARDVACLRATRERAALLLASYARTAEVAALVERDWLVDLALPAAELRRVAPAVRVAVDTDRALDRDPQAAAARLPHAAFATLRTGLTQGPVLVQVPRAGYRTALVCQDCRTPARCPTCTGPLRQDRADAALSCAWCGRYVAGASWRCARCEGSRVRATRVGAERTLDELGRAFPGVALVSSSGDQVLGDVDDAPRLVVATPGAEPRARTGYAAAVLLDGSVLLQRADLRAAEEALRRWSVATALVRPGEQGGTVTIVAPADAAAVQALVRHGQPGFAERELADRRAAHFPPAARWVEVDGDPGAVAAVAVEVRPPEGTEVLGPVPRPAERPTDTPRSRLILRAPLAEGAALVKAVRDVVAMRSARKDPGALRVRVDPVDPS